MIVVLMMGGEPNPALMRDSIHAVVMLVLHGLAGLCIVVCAIYHREPEFHVAGANAFLVGADPDGGPGAGDAELRGFRRRGRFIPSCSSCSFRSCASCSTGLSSSSRRAGIAPISCRSATMKPGRRSVPARASSWPPSACCWCALVSVVLLAKSLTPAAGKCAGRRPGAGCRRRHHHRGHRAAAGVGRRGAGGGAQPPSVQHQSRARQRRRQHRADRADGCPGITLDRSAAATRHLAEQQHPDGPRRPDRGHHLRHGPDQRPGGRRAPGPAGGVPLPDVRVLRPLPSSPPTGRPCARSRCRARRAGRRGRRPPGNRRRSRRTARRPADRIRCRRIAGRRRC